jgi:hypothetical protein
VPTLVLAGDLDSVTSSEGAAEVASRFPSSTFVSVANLPHVTALGDRHRCASTIVLRFVRTLATGDTSCASGYPEVRAVDAFARSAADVDAGSTARRAAIVAGNTVADVLARWYAMSGYDGVGLRGGSFSATGTDVLGWTLRGVRWVEDVAVSGTVTWDRTSGAIRADVRLSGGGVPSGRLVLRWNDLEPLARAHARGRIGSITVSLGFAAP